MVVIVDPHIKRTQDYPVYKEAQELDLFVKNKHGASSKGGVGVEAVLGSISSIRTVGNGTRACTSSTEGKMASGVGPRARVPCTSGTI
jgi:hypothetical protein